MKKRNAVTMIFISFLIILPIALITVLYTASVQKQRNINLAYHILDSKISKLQYAINSRLLSAQILEELVISEGGRVVDFEATAKRLYDGDPALRSIQLAPKGIVKYVYPEAKNEEGKMDLFADPDRRADAEWARDTGNMLLSGPYELKQGGVGIVARNPIYIKNAKGEKEFWGFSVIVLNVPEIFNTAELADLTRQDYYYRIWRNISESEVQTIYSNTTEAFDNTVSASIEVPSGVWNMSICPESGWFSAQAMIYNIIIAVITTILLVTAIYMHVNLIVQRAGMKNELNTDRLTGIYNYYFFTNKIKELVEDKKPFVMYYIDMDNLRQVNYKYGHGEGDNVLCEMAERVKRCIGEDDFAIRMGGDEFAVLMITDESEEYCIEMENRMKDILCMPFEMFDDTFTPDICMGYARYPFDSASADKIMGLADIRMYKEKKQKMRESNGF